MSLTLLIQRIIPLMDMVRLHVSITIMTMICALELQIQLFSEKRREAYRWYGERASQGKIGYGAKNTNLVDSLAVQQNGVVRES